MFAWVEDKAEQERQSLSGYARIVLRAAARRDLQASEVGDARD